MLKRGNAKLVEQAELTRQAADALVGWAEGVAGADGTVRDLEHAADDKRRELLLALVSSFQTPIDAEDVFALSRDLDWMLNLAKDTVREAELLQVELPDEYAAQMARALAEAAGNLARALGELHRRQASAHADAARKCARSVERICRQAIGEALAEEDVRVLISRRELYRQLGRIAESAIAAAERVWHVTVMEA